MRRSWLACAGAAFLLHLLPCWKIDFEFRTARWNVEGFQPRSVSRFTGLQGPKVRSLGVCRFAGSGFGFRASSYCAASKMTMMFGQEEAEVQDNDDNGVGDGI